MKNKELKLEFFKYIETIKKDNSFYIFENEIQQLNCMLFGEESFHVNIKQKSLFIKPLKLLFEKINGDLNDISWVGIIQEKDVNTLKLIIGFENPYIYSNNHKDFIVENSFGKIIAAVPFVLMNNVNQNQSTEITQTTFIS